MYVPQLDRQAIPYFLPVWNFLENFPLYGILPAMFDLLMTQTSTYYVLWVQPKVCHSWTLICRTVVHTVVDAKLVKTQWSMRKNLVTIVWPMVINSCATFQNQHYKCVLYLNWGEADLACMHTQSCMCHPQPLLIKKVVTYDYLRHSSSLRWREVHNIVLH